MAFLFILTVFYWSSCNSYEKHSVMWTFQINVHAEKICPQKNVPPDLRKKKRRAPFPEHSRGIFQIWWRCWPQWKIANADTAKALTRNCREDVCLRVNDGIAFHEPIGYPFQNIDSYLPCMIWRMFILWTPLRMLKCIDHFRQRIVFHSPWR